MVKGKTEVKIRASSVTEEQLKPLVKQHIDLIEKCQLQGGIDDFMKNNMPFLLPLAQLTTRVKWKNLQDVVLKQKPNMHQEECRRFCQEVANAFSHVCNKFYIAKTGGKLEAHAKMLGVAMGLQPGRASPSTGESKKRADSSSDIEMNPPKSSTAAASSSADGGSRRNVIKNAFGISPPPKPAGKKQKVATWSPMVVFSSQEDVELADPPAAAPKEDRRGRAGWEGEGSSFDFSRRNRTPSGGELGRGK